MKLFATRKFRIVVLIVAIACAIVFVSILYARVPESKTISKQPDYSVQVKSKKWDTTVNGRFTVMGIDSYEPLPILILDLMVSNTTDKEFLLNCNLVQSNDNLKTIQDVYFPFWALNIKRDDDLRLVTIPAQATQRGQIAFQLARTDKTLWLDCGSDVKVQVQ